jgi:hypothetical protein
MAERLTMISRSKLTVMVVCTAALGVVAGTLFQGGSNRGFVDSIVANAEARQCFEEARRVEDERMARTSDPTDFSGSTLDEDIRACWEAFDRRTGDSNP